MTPTRWPRSRSVLLARLVVRLASRLVPRARRRDWLAMWMGDLWQLARESSGPASVSFAFGSVPSALSELASEWGPVPVSADIGRGLRRLRTAPGYALLSIAIMTAGVTLNTSIFAVVNGVLIRIPPGIVDANGLVQIGRQRENGDFDNYSYPNFSDLRAGTAEVFSGVAAYGDLTLISQTGAATAPIVVQAVSANFFEVLGARASLGRTLGTPDEVSRAPLIVLSHTFWQREFAGRPDIVGSSLRLDGMVFTIIGVASQGFIGVDVAAASPDGWIPLLAHAAIGPRTDRTTDRGYSWLWLVARLAPQVTLPQARAVTSATHARLAEEHRGAIGDRVAVVQSVGLRPDDRTEAARVSSLLMVAVALVLVMACANLAGLLGARAASRERDLAVCAAIGASHLRLTRELLAEHLATAVIGAVAAWGLTWWTVRVVLRLLPYTFAVDMSPDGRVFLFGVLAATLTSAALGLLPARHGTRVDLARGLRHGDTGRRLSAAPAWPVALQLALSFVLLTCAGLLLRSVGAARAAQPGFAIDSVSTLRVNVELIAREHPDAVAAIVEQLLAHALQQPGVAAAAIATHVPIATPPRTRTVRPAGVTPGSEGALTAAVNFVSDDYFAVLEIPVVRGRTFNAADAAPNAPRVVIVSESMARRAWPDRDAIGQRLSTAAGAEVVGVVRDVQHRSLRDLHVAAFYLPFSGSEERSFSVLVRASTSRPPALSELPRLVSPDLAMLGAAPLRDLLGRSYAEAQMLAQLLATFSLLATALAAAGVYVVVATWVASRRKELGLRVALGAGPADMRRLVFARTLTLAAAGLLGGGIAALAAAQALEAELFGVTPRDPATYSLSGVLLLAVAAGATYLPMRRALHADPVATLKGV